MLLQRLKNWKLITTGSIRKSECFGRLQSQDDRRYRCSKAANPSLLRMLIKGKAAQIVSHIHHEMGLHIGYCKDFGITMEEIGMTAESQGISGHFHLKSRS